MVAIVAPAFIGQFGKNSTPEKFTTAMKLLGFDRVVEVAVGADMCTVEEAEDFLMKVPAEQDFMATSCCPAWHEMVKKLFRNPGLPPCPPAWTRPQGWQRNPRPWPQTCPEVPQRSLLEGMACPGGCVAGAGTLLPVELAATVVGRYQNEADQNSPLESPYRSRGRDLD